MNKIVVTGAGGFIGGNLAKTLAEKGFEVIAVDDFSQIEKQETIRQIPNCTTVNRNTFIDWLQQHPVDFIFHLGARTDTTEFDFSVLEKLNLSYSKSLWNVCAEKNIPFVYASSAATYGAGENGFGDNESDIPKLNPLNPYGLSKQLFDEFVLTQKKHPPLWVGLKFFNVYGIGEAHKGRMSSVVFHAYQQIKSTDSLKLFKSHHPDYKHGEQLRDFIYVSDVVNVCLFFLEKHRKNTQQNLSGIYNLGTGKARTFNDLGKAVFTAMNREPTITYIPMPEDIREKYQYFTEAKMQKLRNAGYTEPFTSLEEGIKKYNSSLMQNDKV